MNLVWCKKTKRYRFTNQFLFYFILFPENSIKYFTLAYFYKISISIIISVNICPSQWICSLAYFHILLIIKAVLSNITPCLDKVSRQLYIKIGQLHSEFIISKILFKSGIALPINTGKEARL